MTRHDLWLCLAGFVASSVNAAAGGGTLLSFPSLLAIGLSPLSANATSTVGLLPGSIASIFAYRRELSAVREDAARLVWPSVIGGVLGAWLLLFLGARVFAEVVPTLLVAASALLVLQPLVVRWLRRRAQASAEPAPGIARRAHAGPLLVFSAALLVGVYAGYFGAGAGILFLGTMGLVLALPLSDVNALKVAMAAISNGVAAITFAVLQFRHPEGSALDFRAALPLCAGALLGGYAGVRVVRRLPPTALRVFSALVGIAIALELVLRK